MKKCRSEQVAFENIFALLIERCRILKNQSKNDWHPRLKSLTRTLSIDDCDQKKQILRKGDTVHEHENKLTDDGRTHRSPSTMRSRMAKRSQS